ncbi:MAG TPA: hypothetical protein PKK23_13960 [Nitrospirales bacterium]|nr:hypothetical protein [Nitrospiraceae bacterium]HNP30148.1 hypothetical protein [Nitrospirales bacterium]
MVKIWAVDSWAQGVSFCGDLDLVVQHVQEEGPPVPYYTLQTTIAKRAKNVRVYLGTSRENTSGISLSSPKLIWSQENVNWETNILSVKVNPLA